MKNLLLTFAKEINTMLAEGKTLKELSQWSFEQRESGRKVPYLQQDQKDRQGNVLELTAYPTKKQKELREFFKTPETGKKYFPKYIFRVDGTGVIFTEDGIRLL
jgi:hypothetical protein